MNAPAELTLHSGPISPVQLALFAAASGDHNPLHLDPEAARLAGFERPVVHGMLSMALAGRLFTQHFGAGSVRMLHTRFAGVALVGDGLELRATLDHVAPDGAAHYSLRGVVGNGSGNGAEVLTGSAVVATA